MSGGFLRQFAPGASATLALVLTLWLLSFSSAEDTAPAQQPVAEENAYPQESLPDSAGGDLSLLKARGEVATVLVCMSVTCPISNEYTPTLNRLAESFRPRGVNVIAINPTAGQTLREMADHAREYKLAFPFLKDSGGKISRRLQFNVTPEVCVFDAGGKAVYRGRIDDRYRARGGAAGEVVTADLQTALEELIAGNPVTHARTKAVGCPIQRATAASSLVPNSDASTAGDTVTFCKQIAPILQEHCQECHRVGGIGPFALTTYDQAVNWAEDVREFVATGKMPPWKPVAGHGDFKNRRVLADAEKDLIVRWVGQGCREGRREDLPEPRRFSDSWRLGTPDLVLMASEEYHVAADGPDVYRNFVLPVEFDKDRFVTALEVLPGNPRVVHHVIAFLDDTGAADRLDARDPGPGYSSSQGFPGFIPVGGLGGWAPGNSAGFLPDGMARILPRGAKVVMQVHYHKNGKEEVDQTRIGIHFAKGKVTRSVLAVPVMPPGGPLSGMTIPAGAANHEVRCAFVLPEGGLALNITPHMHLLGKDMRVTATLPDGKVLPMVYVKDWDFNWQEMYHYREFVDLPAGTRLDLVAHFDNSADNPSNPSRPPKTVHWGEQTSDEMCLAFIEIVPYYEAADESELKLPDQATAIKYLLQGQAAAAGSGTESGRAIKRLEQMFQLLGAGKRK
ncbi:MAG: redoxin domain-containing protein [Planctomycetia bacterium]|nr:redoxin domain-containing protein [Planctomycetia bacterium]